MLFSSIVFLFTFLPIILILYYLVPRPMKNVILLFGSLLFYAWGEPVYIFLMIFSILFNYICGLDIARNLKDPAAAKRSLIFTVAVNLCILGFFKYEGFVLDSLSAVLPVDIPYRAMALPIGISFYTFQILSYIIDVYRGHVKVQTNLLDFCALCNHVPAADCRTDRAVCRCGSSASCKERVLGEIWRGKYVLYSRTGKESAAG